MTANLRSSELAFCKHLPSLGTPLPRVRWLATTDSTNDELKRSLQGGTDLPAVVAAREQTAGRGRLSKSFYSPRGGLYFSIAYAAADVRCTADAVSLAAGVATAQALETMCGEPFAVKWVNDVLYRGKKVCGILCESICGAASPVYIVGIGVNCHARAMQSFLPEKAGATPTDLPPETLAAEIYARLTAYLGDASQSFVAAYNERLTLKGKTLRVRKKDGSEVEATAERADASGLHCRTAAGEEVVARTTADIVTDLYASGL